MKKLLYLILILAMMPVTAIGDLPDISGLSYDELVKLKTRITLAMYVSQEWQEVKVPEGVYKVGEDIPAGHWTIKPAYDRQYLYVALFDVLNAIGTGPAAGESQYDSVMLESGYKENESHESPFTDMILIEGLYFKCTGDVIFTPYTGKPDLGFK